MKNGNIIRSFTKSALESTGGLLHLVPAWVPRAFCIPGRRLKLHPDDLFVLGANRGGIDERWFSSACPADNGPGTPKDEGLSYVAAGDEINEIDIESPAMIRYGDLTKDEFFVPYPTATKGVTIENTGYEPLVILKFFGPDCNPDMPDLG